MAFVPALTTFINPINDLAHICHTMAREHGFWKSKNTGEKIALIHSELSEGLEAFRNGNPPDEHCTELSNAEVELADAVIRIFDLADQKGFNIGKAIVTKMLVNSSRPYRHGKKF